MSLRHSADQRCGNLKFLVAWPKFFLVSAENLHMYRLAQIARACGRVSVGGDPDKRPVNRQQKPAAGGEPANPAKRGTRLKATTDRAFSSLLALQRLAYRRGLSFLPHVRTGAHPIQTMATKPWTARLAGLGWTCPTAQHPTGASWLKWFSQGVRVTDDCMFRFRVSNARGG